MMEPDVELMLGAKSGDTAAFEILVRKHARPVRQFLYRIVRDASVAEDLTQEVFLRVYRGRERYQPSAKFTTWLYRIAGYVAFNWLRDGRRERAHERIDAQHAEFRAMQIADPDADIERWMLVESRRRQVRSALTQLPSRQQTVVRLHKLEGLDCIQIAARMRCSHQAVRSMLFRAYSSLRVQLAHLEPEC